MKVKLTKQPDNSFGIIQQNDVNFYCPLQQPIVIPEPPTAFDNRPRLIIQRQPCSTSCPFASIVHDIPLHITPELAANTPGEQLSMQVKKMYRIECMQVVKEFIVEDE